MRIRLSALATCAAAIFTPGCVLFTHPNGIAVSSDPPGATVSLDRRDTGFVTPCVLAIDADDHQRVDISRPGYQTETRFIAPGEEVYAILWREMSVELGSYDFPLFLNVRDFVAPVKYRVAVTPGRIHVRLDRSVDAAVKAAVPPTAAAAGR